MRPSLMKSWKGEKNDSYESRSGEFAKARAITQAVTRAIPLELSVLMNRVRKRPRRFMLARIAKTPPHKRRGFCLIQS